MGSIMLDLLKLSCRRRFTAASLHSCSYIKHLYPRSQLTINVDTCRQRRMQRSSVRGYANSSSNIQETKSESLQGDKVTSGDLTFDFVVMRSLMLIQRVLHLQRVLSSSTTALKTFLESVL